jgi:hypothetical protein
MSTPTRRLPWTSTQARAAVLADVAGAVVIVAAALGSRRAEQLSAQVLWLNLALLGLGVMCVSHGGLLLAARRAIGHRITSVVPEPAVPSGSASGGRAVSSEWIWVPGTRRAHQDGCLLVAGKETVTVGAARIRAEALQRCEACGR